MAETSKNDDNINIAELQGVVGIESGEKGRFLCAKIKKIVY